MTGGKKIGLGSVLYVGVDASSYDIVGGLLSISGPTFTREVADITSIGASSDTPFIEETPGYISIEPMTVELAYYSTDDAGQQKLKTGVTATTGYTFKLYRGSTDDDAFLFNAHVTGLGAEVPGRSDMITRTVTLNLVGSTVSMSQGIG